MGIKNYIKIARPNHWFKNIFIIPGTIFALLVFPDFSWSSVIKFIIGFLSVCLVASANYVINEWLDAESDKYHPLKKDRPSVSGLVAKKLVYIEYILLVLAGLGLAFFVSYYFLATAVLLLVMGVIYNVKPFRTKDRVYLDVLSESINNPIRFLLGWFIIANSLSLPSSLLIAYWMGGAFLMAVKRYSEYRFIGNKETAGLYRRSFRYYNENNLLVSILFYAMSFAFFLGVFMVKYRIELLLSLPLFSLLFCWYLRLGMKDDSPAQRPEGLYKEKLFTVFIVFIIITVAALMFLNIPFLSYFLEKSF
jgi:decaprenyl-phosphate phosphoribosyltransferase